MPLVGFFKNKTKLPKYLKEHHFTFVERPFHDAVSDILKWGWSQWWPKDSPVQYTLTGSGPEEIGPGRSCQMVMTGKFLKSIWSGEVIQLKGHLLQIEWKSGMMIGQEFVIAEERSNGTRVDHRVRYTGSNLVGRFLWLLFFRKKYHECILQAMDALKTGIGNFEKDMTHGPEGGEING
ncbi:MAG: hypothetical protein AB1650_02785 [Candidatus Omnitrophota bacterium]